MVIRETMHLLKYVRIWIDDEIDVITEGIFGFMGKI